MLTAFVECVLGNHSPSATATCMLPHDLLLIIPFHVHEITADLSDQWHVQQLLCTRCCLRTIQHQLVSVSQRSLPLECFDHQALARLHVMASQLANIT